MRFDKIMLAVLAISAFAFTGSPLSADIVFDFRDGSGFDDSAGIGATFTGSDIPGFDGTTNTTAPLSTLVASVVDVIGQDGSSAASGDANTDHTLNVTGQQALGVNTSNGVDGFITSNDLRDFNPGEAFIFSFNQDILLTNVELESFVAGTVFTISSGGTTVTLGDSFNALSDFAVTAGVPVTIEFVSAVAGGDTSVRVESFQAVITEPDPSPSTYDVYIVAGQSNADGRGLESDLPVNSPFRGLQNDVLISYLNPGDSDDASVSSNGFVTLRPGFSVAPGESRASSGLPSGAAPDGVNNFGPELSFASAIGQATGSGNPVAIIKVTRGGTNLRADWRVGAPAEPGVETGFLYTALLDHIAISLAQLTADGSTANIEGFIWHQGESDRNSTSVYADRFTHLVEGVRAEFGADIPFVLGELSRDREDNDAFNESLDDFVTNTSVPSIGLVTSEELGTSDETHFTADSQIVLGQRYATTLDALTTSVLKGDVDLNGMVDFGDIAPFISVLQAGTFQAEADCNCDTVVDFGDIATFITILQGG